MGIDSSAIPSLHSASGSFLNSDEFTESWNKVRMDGKYIHYAWTVKVDPDAVFIPERLRIHVMNLPKIPDNGLYFLNCKYHDGNFWMFGAIEVLSKDALKTYF